MSDAAPGTFRLGEAEVTHLEQVTRRSLPAAAVDRDAVLMPAHFSAPHAFRVRRRGDDFAVVDHT